MELCRHLHHLSQKDPCLRREALEKALETEGLPFTRQEATPSTETPRGVTNLLLTPWSNQPGLLFCAHHDAVPGSFGANDNAAALCILIALAKSLRDEGFPASFVFFDGEESGRSGSRLYASQLDRPSITGVVNLDICGYGDTIVVCDRGHAKKAPVMAFCSTDVLERHDGRRVKYLPESDDSSFSGLRIPTISVAVVPRWDIQYLNALSSMGSGLLGRPPEFGMIVGQMEIASTMHGGYRDTPDWVQPEAMGQVYGYLMDALHTPVRQARRPTLPTFLVKRRRG